MRNLASLFVPYVLSVCLAVPGAPIQGEPLPDSPSPSALSRQVADGDRRGVAPDLAVQLDGPDYPLEATPGRTTTVVVSLANYGGAASNVVLSVDLPSVARFHDVIAPDGWTPSTPPTGGSGPITFRTNELLADPGGRTFVVIMRIDSGASPGSEVPISASASSANGDADLGNNSASSARLLIAAPSSANLSVSLVSPNAAATRGSNLVLQARVQNSGAETATDVVVALAVPTGNSLFATSSSRDSSDVIIRPGSFSPVGSGAVVCFLGPISPNETETVTIGTDVLPTSGESTSAREFVTATSSDAAQADETASLSRSVSGADIRTDLEVSFGDGQSRSDIDELATQFTVRNNGAAAAPGVFFVVLLRGDNRFLEASTSQGMVVAKPTVGSLGAIVVSLGTLQPGAEARIDRVTTAGHGILDGGLPGARNDDSLRLTNGAILDDDPSNNFLGDPALCATGVQVLTSEITWDAPAAGSGDERPAPTNVRVEFGQLPECPDGVVAAAPGIRRAARRDDRRGQARGQVLLYKVYRSRSPNPTPTPRNLFTTVRPSQTGTFAGLPPGGGFFTVTAVYPRGESAPASPGTDCLINSVRMQGKKLLIGGIGFSETAEVRVDGVAFRKRASRLHQEPLPLAPLLQKGKLADGRTAPAAIPQGATVTVEVRNGNGTTSTYMYSR
jgi:hypothetical protein